MHYHASVEHILRILVHSTGASQDASLAKAPVILKLRRFNFIANIRFGLTESDSQHRCTHISERQN